jgi:glycosyltransferase involved in cell wall biosynthesis
MKKVLVFFVDLPPFKGIGTSGGGLRAWSIYEGLKSSGFDVIPSIPNFQYLSKKYWDQIDDNLKSLSWKRGGQEKIIKETDPDVVIFTSNWAIMDPKEKLDIPTVIDLHGPTLLEGFFFNGNLSNNNIRSKIRNLSLGDFYIFVNRRQREYFSGWLLMAGILLDREFFGTIPVSLSPNMPDIDTQARSQKKLTFVYGGGFYPWQDPTNGIGALAKILERTQKGELWMFTESHKISQSETNKFNSFVSGLERNPTVKFKGIIPRDDLLKEYGRANVALDLMNWNLERELAFTTRTVEYLWAGLPVIYNNYSELSEYITRHKAGWCIDPENHDEIKETIEHILDNPAEIIEYGRNAQRLVRENFTWDVTMQPLVDFCKNPKKRDTSEDIPLSEFSSKDCEQKKNTAKKAIQCYADNGAMYTLWKTIDFFKGKI